MDDTPSFRVAQPEDVEGIVALVERAYRGEASRGGWTTEADLLDGQRTDRHEVSELMGSGRGRFLVAHLQGQLVASMWQEDQDFGLYVGMIAVDPARQGRGLGRALLRRAEVTAAARVTQARIRMTVIAQRTDILAWYERLGYLATGERAPFPYGDPRFGLPRRSDLHFVVLEKALAGVRD